MKDLAQTVHAIATDLGIDAAEMERRLQFLAFTPRDEALLVALHDEFARRGEHDFFVEEFYGHLLAFDPTRALLADDATLVRLKHTQGTYFERLTAGKYDLDYLLDRLRIGVVHDRVGLTPQWYIGAYGKYLTLLAPRIRDYYRDDPEKTLDTFAALLKIVFYDVGLAIDAYIHAAQVNIQAKAAQLKALNDMAVAIASSLSLKQVAEAVLHHGIRLAGVPASCLAIFHDESGEFREWYTQGLSEHFVKDLSFRPGGLAEQVLDAGGYVLSSDRAGSAHRLSALARQEGIRAFLCLPLISHARRIGVLYFYRQERDDFSGDEIDLLSTFAHIAAAALENAELHRRALDQAATDALTGLYNRRVLDERLAEEIQRTRRFGQVFSLLLLDLDYFKRLNDRHGHVFGDSVLQTLARILRLQARDIDLVARYGGEEFVFLLPATDGSGARLVAERVRQAVAEADFSLPGGERVPVTVSIGIATFPENADSAEALVARADHALYTAKNTGRNRVYLYRDTLKAEIEGNPGRIAELLNQNLDYLQAIVSSVDTKAPFLRNHSACVERLVLEFGQALALSGAQIESLRLAARLHDIGIVTIPDALLTKAASLSGDEWEVLHEHPVTAAAIMEQVPAFAGLAPVVRAHHERYDGTGYPDGLKGEAIPYLARILTLADAYCALTAERARRHALKPADAHAVIEAGRGLQFDPQLTDSFQRLLESREPTPSG